MSPPQSMSALVGTGFIGPVHVEALRRLGQPVLGVVGSTPTRAEAAVKRLKLPHAYGSMEEMLNDPRIQVVHLASPNHHHHTQCKQVLAAGKHLICEKPLALTATETAELVQLARQAPVVTAVCYNVRFYPVCQEARQRIAAGTLGTIYHINGSYVQDWLLHETDFNWRVLADQGGKLRAIADIGTHWLDLVTWVAGQQLAGVCADLRTFLPTRQRPRGGVDTFQSKLGSPVDTEPVAIDTEDYGSVLLRFQGGASGTLTVSQVNAGRKNSIRFEIAGSRGALAWDSERPNELWLGHRDRANELLIRDPALLHPSVQPLTSYPGGHNEGFPDTFKHLFASVYRYIENGDYRAPRAFPTFEDGHREVVLGEAILQSHQERRWVEVAG
jgi:predicted dehydrogenase